METAKWLSGWRHEVEFSETDHRRIVTHPAIVTSTLAPPFSQRWNLLPFTHNNILYYFL
jgi:hypothetical protein